MANELQQATPVTMLTPVEQEKMAFELIQRKAKVFTQSTIVPVTYQGNDKVGNVIIALDLAKRMNANPLMVMQNLDIIYGRPAWSSKFLIAAINACGKFTPIRYEFKNDNGDIKCRCYAYEKYDTEHKERLEGPWVSISMAKKEGWYDKKGSKWQTMPELMLRYRAAAFWQRLYAPEITMGLMTADEAEDIRDENFQEIKDERKQKLVDMAMEFIDEEEEAPVEEEVEPANE